MNTSSPNVLIEGNVSLPDRTEYCQVSIKDGIICDIVFDRQQFSTSNISLRSDQILCPGFIDPQINGGFGKEFKTDEDAFAVVANNIPRYGVTSIVPTITTKRIADYKRHISLLKRNHTNLLNSARILGIHIEGPALNPEKKGAHPRDLLVQPREIDLFEIITPDVLIFTLAPELDGGWELADKCIKSGLKVGLGHTLSDYDDIVRHFNTDSMHIVHVYNGMPDLSGRKPGVSGAALNNPDYYASVIADLVHVHPASLDVLWKSRNGCNLFGISDGSAVLGLPTGVHKIGDRSIERLEDRAVLEATNTLVGSVLTMNIAARNLYRTTGCALWQAINFVSLNAAKYLGMDDRIGSITVGRNADLCVIDNNFEVNLTIINGVIVYDSSSNAH